MQSNADEIDEKGDALENFKRTFHIPGTILLRNVPIAYADPVYSIKITIRCGEYRTVNSQADGIVH